MIDDNSPAVGWHNLVTSANVTADAEDPNFPAVNLANPSVYPPWRSDDAAEQYATVMLDGDVDVDYVGIGRHNLGSAGITVAVEGYDGSAWSDVTDEVTLDDDRPVIFQFVKAQYVGIRLRLGAAPDEYDLAEIAVLYVGELLLLQRRIYVGHVPITYGRQTEVANNRSERGLFLGRVEISEFHASGFSIQNMTPDWYRENLEPFVDVCQGTPFFWAWRPRDYPEETGYVAVTNQPSPKNQRTNGMMSIEFQFSGEA